MLSSCGLAATAQLLCTCGENPVESAKKKKKKGHKKFIQKLVRIHVALDITRELSRSPVNRSFSPLFVQKKEKEKRSFVSVSCFNLWFAVPSICLNGDNKGWVEHVSGGG